jgi:MFS transporter, FHS family, glucose/mannose:H+ symporter
MVLGLLAFLSFGAVQATYGPAFAALQARYGVGVGEVGAIVSAHFFGAFIGVVASGMAVARFGYRPLLVGASLVTAAGAFAVGLAPTWAAAIGGAAGIGLGYGLAVALYNFLFARAFGGRSIAAVNVINGSFGVGASSRPPSWGR